MKTDLDAMKAAYVIASSAYYNTKKAVMSDKEFDALELDIRKLDPKWDQLAKTGVSVTNKKTECKLEFPMPSLQKFYPEKIDKWLAKQGDNMLVTHKLDGASLQVIYDKGVCTRVITRGDGSYGGDVSFLIPFLNIPKRITLKTRLVLRCEAVIKAKTFEAKYAADAENARALVNGWLNRKEPAKGLKDVDIVVLGAFNYKMLDSLINTAQLGFSTVKWSEVHKPSGDSFSRLLMIARKDSQYAIDGLVGCNPNARLIYTSADKPKWIAAFKENINTDDAVRTTVEEIIYQESGLGRIVPKIKIKPVRLNGSTVTYATAHNGQWMLDRGLGPGAVVAIVKSGDVIPKIVAVIKKGKLQLPTVPYTMKGVHFFATNRSTESDVRAIHKFFTTLGIEFIASKTIALLYDEGIDTMHDYMSLAKNCNVDKLMNAGLGKIMANKIMSELIRVFSEGIQLRDLMVASNCFAAGVGDRKIKAIEAKYGNLEKLIDLNNDQLRARLCNITGYSVKSADLIINGLPAFKQWLEEAKQYIKVAKPVKIETKTVGILSGVKVSFTGYRSAEQEACIASAGGEVIAFGAKTNILLYKATGKKSAKVEQAKNKGIIVKTFEELGLA